MENWEKTWFLFLQTLFFLLSLGREKKNKAGRPEGVIEVCEAFFPNPSGSWKDALWNFGHLWTDAWSSNQCCWNLGCSSSPKGNLISHFYPVKGPGCWITTGDFGCRTQCGSSKAHRQSRGCRCDQVTVPRSEAHRGSATEL